jgi:hypothetical protein
MREPEMAALTEFYRRAYAQDLIPEPRPLSFLE